MTNIRVFLYIVATVEAKWKFRLRKSTLNSSAIKWKYHQDLFVQNKPSNTITTRLCIAIFLSNARLINFPPSFFSPFHLFLSPLITSAQEGRKAHCLKSIGFHSRSEKVSLCHSSFCGDLRKQSTYVGIIHKSWLPLSPWFDSRSRAIFSHCN